MDRPRHYAHDEPVAGKDVSAVVTAMDRNAQNGLREISLGLEQYFKAQFHATASSR
jgi:hypothetical protein